jgi:hypothetical protein
MDFPDGIFFVPLLDVAVCREAVLRAIAQQVVYLLAGEIASAVQLQAYLRPQRTLTIFPGSFGREAAEYATA